MPTATVSRRIFVFAVLACGSLILPSPAQAQYKLETCEDLKITQRQHGGSVVETAVCVGPTTTFSPKGTQRNVNILYTFPPVPTGAGVTFMVTKNDANGEFVQDVDYAVSPQHTSAYARLTINAPGKYFLRLANRYNKAQVWATAEFTVGADTVGPRATGNTASGGGKVSICKTIDDNWKCVGESSQWAANSSFNVLFENPGPIGVDFIGIMFYKQGAGGKDTEFVNEYQQNIGAKNRRYATVGDALRLPAGVYSVYVIAWDKRQATERRGNLTEYFSKMTLTVK